ncbi:hypothetical protein SLS60_011114 [Paraconiothyrium brasiliense]|uniref:Nephrocystin 3-like N-terminal domain-containing protein n=1 Tax=Paraconiothyrium brasiliense TaxID=300254 RepID=A0ABR3QL66_9PLEO
MADPLSVAASIAGLASLSDLLFRKLFHYVKSVASAEKEVVDLKKEIALLTGVLHNLVLIARDLEADSTVSYTLRPEHVNSCLALLHRLDDELGKIGIKGPGKISKHLQKLAWPFKNIKVRDYIEDVRQQRDTLNAALNADSFKALLESLSVQKDLSKHIRSVETLLNEREKIDTRITLDQERERILDYFLFVDPQRGFQTSVRLRCATTGFWLTEDETFCQWNNGSCTTLWMSGIPGAGKTVLSGLVIQGCMAKASGNRAVAFFYCDYKTIESQKPMHVLACLASQIARQSEDSFQVLKDYYSRLRPRDQLKQEPEVSELLDIIREMSSTFEDVRIVVDGLDECGDNAGSLTENLLSLCDANGGKTYLAFLSRNEADISKAIEKRDHKHIEIAAKSKDLDHYVRSEMELRINTGKLHLRTTKIKDEIIHELVTRASGILEQLLDVLSLDEEQLRIDDEDRPDPNFIFKHCGSLIRKGQYYPELAHFTVLEYLEAIDPEDSRLKHFRLGVKDKSILWRTSTLYLSASNFDQPTTTIISEEGLLDFNHQYPFHLRAAMYDPETAPPEQALDPDSFDVAPSAHMRRLFHPNLSFNIRIIILQRVQNCYKEYRHRSVDVFEITRKIWSPSFGPLHAAATLDLDEICQWLLSQGYNVNEQSSLGGPLECALYGCRGFSGDFIEPPHHGVPEKTIRLLLTNGADASAESTRAQSLSLAAALYMPISEGPFFETLGSGMPIHADTLQYLTDHDRHLTYSGLEEVQNCIQSLEAHQKTYQTRLQLLSLVHRGKLTAPEHSQQNAILTDNEFLEAVKFSVQFNHCSHFEELTRDPRFSAYDEELGLLAHLAARNDAADTMRILIKLHPHAVTRANSDGETSWHIACSHGSEKVLQLLLDTRRADFAPLHERSGRGHTPILSAIQGLNNSCAMLILNALNDAGDPLGGFEILSYATAFGLNEVLERLKQAEFDFIATDEKGCSALFYMTADTTRETVDILLQQGLDANFRNHTGKTALNWLLSKSDHCNNYLGSEMDANWYIRPATAIGTVATSSSVGIADDAGHLPWFYLCSRYIPHIFKQLYKDGFIFEDASLKELLPNLVELSACSAYDESTSTSGISLLIKTFLDLHSGSRYGHSFGKEIATSLQAVLLSKSVLLPQTSDPQLTRLTIWAIHKSQQPLVTLLLDMGVDALVPSEYYDGRSVFDYSCLTSVSVDTMKQVVGKTDAQQLSHSANSSRWAPIILHVVPVGKESALEKLDILLKRGINPNSVAVRTVGQSLVLEAAGTGFFEAVQLLERHQADMRYTNAMGWDIHAVAVCGGEVALMQLLFTRDALPEYWTRRYTLYHNIEGLPTSDFGHVGCNLLHIAAAYGNANMLQTLKDSGFFPDLDQTSHRGYTPLHFAAISRLEDNVKWLISNHVNIDTPATRTQSTPLHIAMAAGNVQHVMALVEAKAQFLPNARGQTPELVAHPESKQELMKLLPYCGVEIPPFVLENLRKPTDLFEAIASDDTDACRHSIKQGVSVNKTFDCGCSPLFVAIATCQMFP